MVNNRFCEILDINLIFFISTMGVMKLVESSLISLAITLDFRSIPQGIEEEY